MKNQVSEPDVDYDYNPTETEQIVVLESEIRSTEYKIRLLEHELKLKQDTLRGLQDQCQHDYNFYDRTSGSHGTDTWYRCVKCHRIK